MALGPSGRRNDPLQVGWMACALVAASIFGAALGLIWQSAGFGGDDGTEAAAEGG